MYKKIDHKDIEYLKSFIPEDRIIIKDDISHDYAHDELGGIESYPEVLIFVLSTLEVSKIMKYAYDNNIPVVPRGSGTDLVGAAVAIEGGIMICTKMMNRILELD